MATKTLTRSRQPELVLRLSIPVSEDPSCDDSPRLRPGSHDRSYEETALDRRSCSNASLGVEAVAAEPVLSCASSCGHNTRSPISPVSDGLSYEGDNINPARFRWMSLIPPHVRRCLLVVIEPPSMGRQTLGVEDFVTANGKLLTATKKRRRRMASNQASTAEGIIEDFCICFSRQLLKKLRDRLQVLLAYASRACCVMYVKRTLLLRGTWRTKTWTKFFMCRIYAKRRALLNNFHRLLEQFDTAFATRYPFNEDQPRVTLVPNRTVPENTFLRMTRQRLRKCDMYFGKMPLLTDPHWTNMAARLTRQDCVNKDSMLARLVLVE